jgi:hypothetical protein
MMRSSAFERRMLFERPGLRLPLADRMVSSIVPSSTAL